MSEHACPYTHIYKRKLNAIKLILFINASCSVKKKQEIKHRVDSIRNVRSSSRFVII